MSIRPIDYNGMVQSSTEVAIAKSHEDNKATLQQAGIAVVFEQQEQQQKRQVNQLEAMDDQGYDREGNGQGARRNRKNQKKNNEKGNASEGDGRVSVKSTAVHKSFDVRI